MFFVEQWFDTNIADDVSYCTYHFKFDPNFISCTLVYKTWALWSMEVKPKIHSVKYAVRLLIIPPESTDPDNQPAFRYTNMLSDCFIQNERVKIVEVLISYD